MNDKIKEEGKKSAYGGGIKVNTDDYVDGDMVTRMICRNCGRSAYWKGNFLGGIFLCPICNQRALEGKEFLE